MSNGETAVLVGHDELAERIWKAVDEAADDASSRYPIDPIQCYQEAWRALVGRLAFLVEDLYATHEGPGGAGVVVSEGIRGKSQLID